MNFLALFLGLGIERLLTHLFHLREFHWLDPVFDWVLRNQRISQPKLAIAAAALTATVVVIPVGMVEWGLQDRLAQLPEYVFAVIVLLFCLGPRDLAEEVNDYCKAIEDGDDLEIREIADELLECKLESDHAAPDVEAAIYAQANNRIFGVVFWFVFLGPTGAWLFRVLDLMQRRAVYFACQDSDSGREVDWPLMVEAILLLHRLFAWIPSRLLAIGYMLAGSFDGALVAWRDLHTVNSALFPGPNDQLLGAVGRGAAADGEGDVIARARVASALVSRTL